MKTATKALVTGLAVLAMNSAMSAEPAAEQVELKDGSTLFLHPDGTGRMVDQHGKPSTITQGPIHHAPVSQGPPMIVDQHGKPLPIVLDQHGKHMPLLDTNGKPVPIIVDSHGKPLPVMVDTKGKPLPE